MQSSTKPTVIKGSIKHIKRLVEKITDGEADFRTSLAEYCNAPKADSPSINNLLYNRQVRSCIFPELQREVGKENNQDNEENKRYMEEQTEHLASLSPP